MLNQRKKKRLAFLSALFLLAFVCYGIIDWFRWRERPDPVTGVAVELRPAHQVIKVGQAPSFSVTLVNHGQQTVMLIEPGDGSDCGWRTPLVEWSRSSWFRGGRCGNINALDPEEVFILKPGDSRQLCQWVGAPQLSGPGKYRVAVRYSNRPDQDWSGLPLGEHDDSAMKAVSHSTPVSAVSNTVEIVVEK